MKLPVSSVVLEKTGYKNESIKHLVELSHDVLGLDKKHHGMKVLLKPNLISSTSPPLACTHHQFVRAVAEWYVDQGAAVSIGDSPAFGSCKKVCDLHGITEAVKKIGVRIVEFSKTREVVLRCGVKVPIALDALDSDLLVGLPKIKAHNQMYVTLAVKNIFGTIRGVNKAVLHMMHGKNHDGFAEIILDLIRLFPHQMHFVDGIETMHRSGPMDGEPLLLGCFGASKNPCALDTSLLHLLGLDCTKSPLWRVANRNNVVGSDLSEINFPLRTPESFHGSGFSAPAKLNGIRFNPFRFCKSVVKKSFLKVIGS